MVTAARKAKAVEVGVSEAKGGGAEQTGEGEVVGRVGEGSERIKQVANFRAVVKALARDGDERDTGSFKCIFVNGKCGGGAKEQRHVFPLEVLLFAQFVEARSEGGGGSAAARLRILAQPDAELDERRVHAFPRLWAVCGERRKGDTVGPGRVVRLAHQRGDQAPGEIEQGRGGAGGGGGG